MFTTEWLARWGPKLTNTGRRVYDALATRFSPGQDGLVWFKANTLAKLAGFARRQSVSDGLTELKRHGLIDIITWPITIDLQDKLRTIGGGRGRGKHNIFVMLHVGEDCKHYAERVRPGIADLEDHEQQRHDFTIEMMSRVMAGESFNTIRSIINARYPHTIEYGMYAEPAPSEDVAPGGFGLDSIHMAATLIPLIHLEHRFPLADRPNMSLVWQRPGHNERMMRNIEVERERGWGRLLEAVKPVYTDVLDEVEATQCLLASDRLHGRGERFAQLAPTMHRLHEQLNIIPHYIYNAATDHAMDAGVVFIHADDSGKPVSFECKSPEKWSDEETIKLAMVNVYAEGDKPDPKAIKDAQAVLLENFVRGVCKDENGSNLTPQQRHSFTADKWNEWAKFERSLVVPLVKVTASDVAKINARSGRHFSGKMHGTVDTGCLPDRAPGERDGRHHDLDGIDPDSSDRFVDTTHPLNPPQAGETSSASSFSEAVA